MDESPKPIENINNAGTLPPNEPTPSPIPTPMPTPTPIPTPTPSSSTIEPTPAVTPTNSPQSTKAALAASIYPDANDSGPQVFSAQPSVNGQPFSQQPPSDIPFAANSGGKKKLLMFALPLALILLLGGGYVFGLYLPNRPQTVWNTGLSRSGKAINEFVNTATEEKSLKQYDKSQITTKLEGNSGKQKFSGSFDVKFDKTKADGTLNVNMDAVNGKDIKLVAKFLSEVKDKKVFPNIYLQISGFKNLGLDALVPNINKYDGKWISMDQDSLKQFGLSESISNTSDTQLTATDYSEVIKGFVDVSNQYVLTDDNSKAVWVQKSYVGKEKVENVSAYHFIVGLNKAHAKDYCQALLTKIADTSAYKKLIKDSTTKDSTIKECKSSVDSSKDSDTFDLWIDAKYKLIHKIRLTDEKDKDSYTEFGQNYSGGDKLETFFYSQEGKSKGKANGKLTSNFKAFTTDGTFTFDYPSTGSDSDDLKLKLDISVKPFQENINVTQPTGTVPISQILKELGLNP